MKIALALSGGVGRGGFHAGVLQALDEFGFEIVAITGTSIGAIVGSSYASGVKPKQIAKILASKRFRRAVRFNYFRKGLLRMKEEDPVYKELIMKNTFEELPIATYVSVTNLDEGISEYINHGAIVPYCIASASIFPIFKPVTINNTHYIDGGFMQNIALEPLQKYNLPIICVNLHVFDKIKFGSFFSLVKRAFFVSWNSLMYKEIDKCTVCIGGKMVMGTLSLFSFKDTYKAYRLGYTMAYKEIRKLFDSLERQAA